MEIRPMISVLMPVYNVEQYVRQAIESILSQTYTDFELIIVNDGSTDRTHEIIYSFQDDRIRIYNQNNQGISSARNHLIELAAGKYLAWMDGDDISFPFRFERQISFLERHPDFIMVGSSAFIIDKNGKYRKMMFSITQDEKIRWQMLFNNSFANSSVVFRSDIVVKQKLKFSSGLAQEDYRFWIELIKFGKSKNILYPLIAYRTHDNQVTKRYEKERNKIKHSIIIDNLKHFEKSITYNDVDVIKNWYWGIKRDIDKNDIKSFEKLVKIVINAKSKNYYDFTNMFREFYDKLILKNLLFKINNILPILKILYIFDKAGIFLMPFRFTLIPFRIASRIFRKILALLCFCVLYLTNQPDKKKNIFGK